MKNKSSMSHLLKPHKNKSLEICKQFTEKGFYHEDGTDFGSLDTSVREIFITCLLYKLKEDIEKIPNANEWGLYNEDGYLDVGQKMTDALRQLYNEIDNSLNFEITEIYEFYGFKQFEV